jgi:hypothetical protein
MFRVKFVYFDEIYISLYNEMFLKVQVALNKYKAKLNSLKKF